MVAACWPDLQVLCVGGVEVSCKGLTAVGEYLTCGCLYLWKEVDFSFVVYASLVYVDDFKR